MTQTFDDVYAVPGEQGIIDVIRPDGLTGVYGETFDQLRVRYPNAVRMSYADWQAQAVKRQQTPLAWLTTTAQKYEDMLNVLPPIAWGRGAFCVGEPHDHCIATGQPRYEAYRQHGERFYVSSRPVTVRELRAALDIPIG